MRGKWIGVWLGAALAVAYLRLFLGVDLGDEPFYVAMPYRFLLGDRPFIDEWNPTQGAALIEMPFVRLFIHLRGGTDGILLYARHLYFLLSCLLGLAAFRMLRPHLDAAPAAAIALIPICFVPLGLPTLSYNTIGYGAFTIGIFLALRGTAAHVAGAGILHGVAALAYPPMAIASAAFAGVRAGTSKENRLKYFAIYSLAAVATVAAVFASYRIGPSDLLLARERLNHGSDPHKSYGLMKLFDILAAFARYLLLPGSLAALLSLAAALFAERRGKRALAAGVALAGLAILCVLSRASVGGIGSHGLLISFAALGAILFRRLDGGADTTPRALFFGVWLPSVILAVTMAWTSTNGILNAGVGVVGAAMVTAFLFVRWIGELAAGDPRLARMTPAVPLLLLAALFYFNRTVFRDGDVTKLTARITEGPFQGLMTHPEKKPYIDELIADITSAASSPGKILIYPHFPAGYLVTPRRPLTTSVWNPCMNSGKDDCRAFFQNADHAGLLVVRLKRIMYQETVMLPTEAIGEPYDGWVKETCRKILDKPNYEFFNC